MNSKHVCLAIGLVILLSSGSETLKAQEAEAGGTAAQELAKKLSNPIASLISFPLQANFDFKIGPEDGGWRETLNVQPVIPISISKDWNMISRTILPLTYQSDVVPGIGSQGGLGDVVQSLFFSPQAPTSGGLIWGAGPVLLFPTATNDRLGADKWGAGPTFVVLKQQSGWTFGALGNHIWSYAGDDDRGDVSTTFVQPFVARTTKTLTTYNLNTETTYNWKADEDEWSVPINFSVSQLTKFGKLPVSLTGGLRYWLEAPPNAASGWGFRFGVTFLFPK
jgi:hypothetical protein